MWRTLDVAAVWASLRSDDRHVAAGSAGMGRRVQRPRVAAQPGDLAQVGPFELVVTTASTLLAAADGDLTAVVTAWASDGVAGVAVRLDAAVDLPTDALAAADRAGLPVVTFPTGATLSDVTAWVLDAILAAQGARLDRVLDIDQRFARIVATGGGPGEIASTLHALLGCPVAILGVDGRPLVVVPADAGDVALAGQRGARRDVTAGEQVYGTIAALSDGRELADDEVLALERAAAAVAVRFAQAAVVTAAQEGFAAMSLEELIAGRTADAVEVAERAASFGWDLGRPRAVLLASLDPPADSRRDAALATIAAAARATLGRDAIVWTRSTTIAALIAPETAAPAERRDIAERLRRELDARLRSATVSIGVGRRVDDPSRLAASFAEARRAVDVGRWAQGRHVTEVYDELGLERLLASTPSDDLAGFVEHAIGPLLAHDRAHRAELVPTLQAWLDTRNMAAAARRMHVHYNTLKNRLERIEDILGPVLADARRSLECEVALYVARHHDEPRPPVPPS